MGKSYWSMVMPYAIGVFFFVCFLAIIMVGVYQNETLRPTQCEEAYNNNLFGNVSCYYVLDYCHCKSLYCNEGRCDILDSESFILDKDYFKDGEK